MRRQRFTPPLIESKQLVTNARRASHGRIEVRDAASHLMLRVTSKGARSFITRPRFKGRAIRLTYNKPASVNNYSDAKLWSEGVADLCGDGIDPREVEKHAKEQAQRNRFDAIVETFLLRHASKNRSAPETERIFNRYVLPIWHDRVITEITRRDVAHLLDLIEDKQIDGPNGQKLGGPTMADRTLAAIRKLFNWHAARDETFSSPIVPGMGRTNGRERARDRVLSDSEIRVMWPLLGRSDTFGAIVKSLFLTAQRRGEVAGTSRSEIDDEGVWTIAAEHYKTKRPHFVPLSKAVRKIFDAEPVYYGSDYVFTTIGRNPFSGFSKAKKELDASILNAMRQQAAEKGQDPSEVEAPPQWQLHDIRRTAKTLMGRAGVRPDISERVLGHVIPGVEAVYDRYSYADEKRAALEALASEIEKIVGD